MWNNQSRLRVTSAIGLIVLVVVGLTTIAFAQLGPSISLNSPVSFPSDI